MKKSIVILLSILCSAAAVQAKYPVGVSLGMTKVPTAEKLAEIKQAGIDHV